MRILAVICVAAMLAISVTAAMSVYRFHRWSNDVIDRLDEQWNLTKDLGDKSYGYKLFCNDINAFARAARKVRSIPYANPGANCYDQSKIFVDDLKRNGIASSIMINEGRKHAWVAVWVEADTGRFISPDNPYSPILEVRDDRLRVVCSN